MADPNSGIRAKKEKAEAETVTEPQPAKRVDEVTHPHGGYTVNRPTMRVEAWPT